MVRATFRMPGLIEHLRQYKNRGVSLGYIVELMCIGHLSGWTSMNEYARRVESVIVREELCHGYDIGRKTMELLSGFWTCTSRR